MKNIDTTLVNSKIEQAVAAAAAWETDREGLLGCLACTDYTTLLQQLTPGTEYECRVSVDGTIVGSQNFSTAPATLLTDGSFDNWNQDGKLWNPWPTGGTSFWDTGNKGAVTISNSNSIPTDETCNGSGLAASLESKYLVLKFAAGNIFTFSFSFQIYRMFT